MFKKTNRSWIIAAAGALALTLSGCGDSKYVESEKYQRIQIKNTKETAEKSLSTLERDLSSGSIRNAKLISLYADQVEKINPELKIIINELRKDSGVNGALITGIKRRLKDNIVLSDSIRKTLDSSEKKDADYYSAITKNTNTVVPEFDAIIGASQMAVFNDALGDVVNALADMSKDTLARVDGKKSSDFYKETGAKNVGAATMLVGNENYGNWKKDSSGNSFWAFYGQMSMMNSLMNMGGSPYYYNSWNSQRPYSSYNDHYRSRYSSQASRNSRNSMNSHYKIKPNTRSKAASGYINKNPTVTKKFNKFDNQFAAKRPQSKVVSRTSATKPKTVSKVNSKKWGNQYSKKTTNSNSSNNATTNRSRSGSSSTRSTGGTRSSSRGK
jgi:hypothetical protein